MCIPKGSQNKACAEAFINFMCREDIAKMNVDYIYYSTPIQTVADNLDIDDERILAVINPSKEVTDRCEFFHDTTDAMDLYEQVWMEVRLARFIAYAGSICRELKCLRILQISTSRLEKC